jgi:hypothetical protein
MQILHTIQQIAGDQTTNKLFAIVAVSLPGMQQPLKFYRADVDAEGARYTVRGNKIGDMSQAALDADADTVCCKVKDDLLALAASGAFPL